MYEWVIFLSGSTEKEKAYALNEYLNNNFFSKIEAEYDGHGEPLERLKRLYKYRMAFKGEIEDYRASFSTWHSMLARIVLDFKASNTSRNEREIIKNLRENTNKIIQFAYDNENTSLTLKNCDRRYQRFYKEMLRHVLISSKDIPQNINVNSLRKVTEDLTYVIDKK